MKNPFLENSLLKINDVTYFMNANFDLASPTKLVI